MDCSKSWELMMRKTDGQIQPSDAEKLGKHIGFCGECRETWASLGKLIEHLEALTPQAPDFIEKSVMTRLCSVRQKEKAGMLPYVVSPAALIFALLAIFAFNAFKAGPIPMMDETAHALSLLVKILQAVAAAADYVFKVLHLSQLLIALSAGLIVWVLCILFKNIKKMSDNRTYWRASK